VATQLVPFIPDSAPFTPEQRGWLNGFLAGLYSGATTNGHAAAQPASLKIAVLYASQSGTGEGLAKKVVKELKLKGHAPALASLDTYDPAALAEQEHAVIVASTYGEGDPPDGVKHFYDKLCMDTAPRLDKLHYSVLALGDRNYEHFCKFGIDLDQRLQSLGAGHICERVDCDVDLDEPFSRWKSELLSRLDAIATNGSSNGNNGHSNGHANGVAVLDAPPKPSERVQVHTRDNPYLAAVVDKHALTHDVSSKLTLHIALSLDGSEVFYEAGDACGVIPQNDPALVADILGALKLSGEEQVDIPKAGAVTMHHALTHHLQITGLNRKLVAAYAAKGECSMLQGLLLPEQQTHLDTYTYDRGIIDLLTEFPGIVIDAAEFAAMLPKLAPRLYSISSSPLAHAGQVHTTVAVVRYRSHNRERGGVCSTLFADRTSVGDRLPVYIQQNKKFRLPKQQDAPIIMIGPGTGIAPFRAFLHERRATGATGRNWLFFGERSAATDFLYRDELEAMVADQHLTRLDLAFSRDQERKIYVQDRMLEQAALFWSWLQDGASIYVCGDALRMAKDVDQTLHTIVEQQGEMDAQAAQDYVEELKDQHRYHRDVY
jgi:sulfite reductase (NADPH) flavoprotein alpha-component